MRDIPRKLPDIRYYIGQKLLVIGGVKCEELTEYPRAHCRRGDVVEVVGVSPIPRQRTHPQYAE